MTGRLGTRGGTTRSQPEGAVVQELHRPSVVGLVDSAIWEVLGRQRTVHADDLLAVEIPADAVNVIGNRFNAFARKGWTVAVGWRKGSNPASHGRQSRIWQITEKGRAELACRAGVGGVNTLEKTVSSKGATHPGTEQSGSEPRNTSVGPSPAANGGGDTHSQPGTVAAPDNLMQLPLGDVPPAQTRRASYEDYDLEAA